MRALGAHRTAPGAGTDPGLERSEEHTSELQSQSNLGCRLLLEKKNAALVAGAASLLIVGFVVGADLGGLWTLSMVMAVALLLQGLIRPADPLLPPASLESGPPS